MHSEQNKSVSEDSNFILLKYLLAYFYAWLNDFLFPKKVWIIKSIKLILNLKFWSILHSICKHVLVEKNYQKNGEPDNNWFLQSFKGVLGDCIFMRKKNFFAGLF